MAYDWVKEISVYELREEPVAEVPESKARAAEGRSPPKNTLEAKEKGWLPVGKAGFRHRRKIERAEALLKEVEITLTKSGELVSAAVWQIGQCVLVAMSGGFVRLRVSSGVTALPTISCIV